MPAQHSSARPGGRLNSPRTESIRQDFEGNRSITRLYLAAGRNHLNARHRSIAAQARLLRVWKGIFAAGDWRAKRHPKTISLRRDRNSETTTREKWPQKRPFYLRAISCGFWKTGWWAQSSRLPHADLPTRRCEGACRRRLCRRRGGRTCKAVTAAAVARS